MRKLILFILISGIMTSFMACEKYIYTSQPLVVEEDDFFQDYIDYRSASLGLYAIQQNLTEQLIILGELRGDLLKTTENADADLVEIQNFDISEGNPYASATNFYKLIAACNSFIRTLERNHPEVMEDNPITNNYHKMYGEALCMRGWAYFNAARIYGHIPYIPEGLTSYKAITDYIMNPESTFYVDTGRYVYDITGLTPIDVNDTVYYPVDTIFIDTVQYETYPRRFVDMQTVVNNVNNDLTKRLNDVGVEYDMEEGAEDDSWKAISWTYYSKQYLLAQMALTTGDIFTAYNYLQGIINNDDNSGTSSERFKMNKLFYGDNWRNIFSGIDIDEHIYTMWFGNTEQQTHDLQRLFDNTATNLYYMQPTSKAIQLWETEWRGMTISGGQAAEIEDLYDQSTQTLYDIEEQGTPGDFYRGYGISYVYKDGDDIMTPSEVSQMLNYKKHDQDIDVENMMRGVDTLVYKFTYKKDLYDNDCYIPLYRASSLYLYTAEICIFLNYYDSDGNILNLANYADQYLGSVRWRANLSAYPDDVSYYVIQNPYTNYTKSVEDFLIKANGNTSLASKLQKQNYEELVLAERGKELAFEGERFYDIMRIAKRRDDPSFLANMIADAKSKYSPEQREKVRAKLMNPDNWYVPFFITPE